MCLYGSHSDIAASRFLRKGEEVCVSLLLKLPLLNASILVFQRGLHSDRAHNGLNSARLVALMQKKAFFVHIGIINSITSEC